MNVRLFVGDNGSSFDDGNGNIVVTPDPVRTLYSGDVGTSVLQKFASWYQDRYFCSIDHFNDHYYCVRTSDRTYKFYVGEVSAAGAITDCDVVTYEQIQIGGYNTAWTWSVSHATSGYVDLDGYSGFIYSSYPAYQSNPYMVQVKTDSILILSTLACAIMLVGMALFRVIRRWFDVNN